MQHCLEVLDVAFPPRDEPARVVEPGEEALDDPSSAVPTEHAPVLRRGAHAIVFVRRNELKGVVAPELGVERIAIVRLVADQPRGPRLDEPVFEGRGDEPNFSW